MWLLREFAAQVSRFALALGVLSAGLIIAGTALPMLDEVLSYFRRDAFGLDNALIVHAEGWLLLGIALALLIVLLGFRYAGPLRPVLAGAVIALASATQWAATRAANSDLLDPCSRTPGLCSEHPVGYPNLPTGYGFIVIELGVATAVVAGLLLLVPASAPRRRRRRFAGREDIVWL